MKPRTVDVEVIETLTVKKIVTVHLEPEFDYDDDDAQSEIESRARHISYQMLATAYSDMHGWQLIDSDGPTFIVKEPKFDYDKMTSDEEAKILAEIVTGMDVEQIFAVGMVESTLREELNNAILNEVGTDCTEEQFREGFRDMVHKMSAAQILSYGDVYSELREDCNNQILERWSQE